MDPFSPLWLILNFVINVVAPAAIDVVKKAPPAVKVEPAAKVEQVEEATELPPAAEQPPVERPAAP